ncbi:MAG: matrixin family metalloprotease [Acidimicrobiales bacterium]
MSFGAPTPSVPRTPPAGWYPDPLGALEDRWWDGYAWRGLRSQYGPAIDARTAWLQRHLDDEARFRASQVRYRKSHRTQRIRAAVVATAVLTTMALIGVWLHNQPMLPTSGRGDLQFARITDLSYPTPPTDQQAKPIGNPPSDLPAGPYTVIGLQNDGVGVVTWDPCQPIHYVVNERTLVPGGEEMVREAIDEVSRATGLRFVLDGSTDEVPTIDRAPTDRARYGDRWSPLLVAWSDPSEFAGLEGDVIGRGGSNSVTAPRSGGRRSFVSGMLVLDGPDMAEVMTSPRWGRAAVKSVVLHELGHVVGLGHVDDRSQLMNPEMVLGVNDFGVGDRAGLASLGTGQCFDRI